MKKVKIAGKEVEIPSSWGDISFRQFNSFLKITKSEDSEKELNKKYDEMDEDIRELQMSLDNIKFNTKMVAFWTDLSDEEISMCDFNDVEKILKEMSFLNETYQPIPLSKFKYKDEVYYLPEIGMAKENFGTFVEAEQVEINNKQLEKGSLDVLPKQAAIIAKKKGEKRGLINDEIVDKRAKEFENLDMATIWDIGFFLSQRESKLMSSFLIYLKQVETLKQQQQLKEQ